MNKFFYLYENTKNITYSCSFFYLAKLTIKKCLITKVLGAILLEFLYNVNFKLVEEFKSFVETEYDRIADERIAANKRMIARYQFALVTR